MKPQLFSLIIASLLASSQAHACVDGPEGTNCAQATVAAAQPAEQDAMPIEETRQLTVLQQMKAARPERIKAEPPAAVPVSEEEPLNLTLTTSMQQQIQMVRERKNKAATTSEQASAQTAPLASATSE